MKRLIVLLAAAMMFVHGLGCVGSDGEKEQGTELGPCYPNGTCNEGLVCTSGLCVKLPPLDSAPLDQGVERTDAPLLDLPATDLPLLDGAPDGTMDAPAPDLPLLDLPLAEGAPDGPLDDLPVSDLPVSDLPAVDLPVPDLLVADLPASDATSDGGSTTAPPISCNRCNGTGMKNCKGTCVQITDPATGCGLKTCDKCVLSNAFATCSASGTCAVKSCHRGWADCDKNPANGCEKHLGDTKTCTSCTIACKAGELCQEGVGCVTGCAPPLTTCGSGTRCVNLMTSTVHCGGCGKACPNIEGVSASCTMGTCSQGSCEPGYTPCGSECKDLSMDDWKACGSCTNDCWIGIPKGGIAWCKSGKCSSGCKTGETLCGGACVITSRDSAHCGGCGKACPSTQFCAASTCRPKTSLWLVSGLSQQPLDIAVDATHVYWTTKGGNVQRVSKAGGPVTTLATGQGSPVRLTLDATHVYWSNFLGAAIMRAAKSGPGSPQLFTAANKPHGVITDASWVYWADTGSRRLMRAAKSGGAGQEVAGWIAFHLKNKPYTKLVPWELMAVDSTGIYVEACPNGMTTYVVQAWRVEIATSTYTQLAHFGSSMSSGQRGGATGETSYYGAYIHSPGGMTLINPNKLTGLGGYNKNCPKYSFKGMTVDADFLYWTVEGDCNYYGTNTGTGVMAACKNFGDFGSFGSGPVYQRYLLPTGKPGRMAVDTAHIYWVDDKAIGRLPRM